jgi:hypothetical protein
MQSRCGKSGEIDVQPEHAFAVLFALEQLEESRLPAPSVHLQLESPFAEQNLGHVIGAPAKPFSVLLALLHPRGSLERGRL